MHSVQYKVAEHDEWKITFFMIDSDAQDEALQLLIDGYIVKLTISEGL